MVVFSLHPGDKHSNKVENPNSLAEVTNKLTKILTNRITDSYLAVSETGEDTDIFFSFFPEPGCFVPLLCFGEPLDFLDEGESLELNCSGEA